MKYIEFLGLPGSGKTTTTDVVLSILRSRQRQVFSKVEIKYAVMRLMIRKEPGWLWRVLRMAAYLWEGRMLNIAWQKHRCSFIFHFMSEYPQLTRQIIECGERANPPHWMPREVLSGKNLTEWFFDIASYYQAGEDSLPGESVGLLDEGFCQHAYYLFAFWDGSIDGQRLESYLDLIPKPDLIVFLVSEPEQCEERMHARSKGVSSDILRPLTVSQRLAVLDERLQMYIKIAGYLENYGVKVIRLAHNDYHHSRSILEEQLAHF